MMTSIEGQHRTASDGMLDLPTEENPAEIRSSRRASYGGGELRLDEEQATLRRTNQKRAASMDLSSMAESVTEDLWGDDLWENSSDDDQSDDELNELAVDKLPVDDDDDDEDELVDDDDEDDEPAQNRAPGRVRSGKLSRNGSRSATDGEGADGPPRRPLTRTDDSDPYQRAYRRTRSARRVQPELDEDGTTELEDVDEEGGSTAGDQPRTRGRFRRRRSADHTPKRGVNRTVSGRAQVRRSLDLSPNFIESPGADTPPVRPDGRRSS